MSRFAEQIYVFINRLVFLLGLLWKGANSIPDRDQMFIVSDPFKTYVEKYELDDEGNYRFVYHLPPSHQELNNLQQNLKDSAWEKVRESRDKEEES